MENIVSICKALGDSTRFRIFMLLQERALCVCEILTVFEISGATLSAHLKVLEHAELITHRKDGRWVEYFINPAAGVWKKFLEELEYDKTQITKDRSQIKKVTREICSAAKN